MIQRSALRSWSTSKRYKFAFITVSGYTQVSQAYKPLLVLRHALFFLPVERKINYAAGTLS